MTDSFYIIESPLDVRGKHEYEADEWAIKKLIPKEEIDNAMTNGCTEICPPYSFFS